MEHQTYPWHLSSAHNHNQLNLELGLEPCSSSSSPPPSLHTPKVPAKDNKLYSCNFCQKMFYSSQALGGHQNAHRLERTLAKKSTDLWSAVKPLRMASNGHHVRPSLQSVVSETQPSLGRLAADDMRYAGTDLECGSSWSRGYIDVPHHEGDLQEDFSQLDLSLRL